MDVPIPAPKSRIPGWLLPAVGYVIAPVCLFWVFKDINFQEVERDFRSLEWKWVSLAVVCDLSIYICGGWRWSVLVNAVTRVSFWRAVQSIYIGLFANEVLPLRTGEVIRCYLMSLWNHIPLSLSISSAGVERIMDGVWLIVAFIATSVLIPLPHYLIEGARFMAVVLIFIVGILVGIVFWKHHAHTLAAKSRWGALLQRVIDGLHTMGNRRTMGAAWGISLLYLLLQIIPVWALMKSYGLDLNFWAASAVLIIIRLGTVIPNAPGNVGSFQFFCVLAMGLFGVDKTDAAGFSLVLFGALTLPLIAGGFIATALTGLNLGEIRLRAKQGFEAQKRAI